MSSYLLSLDQSLNLTGFAIFNNIDGELYKYGVFDLKDIKGDNVTDEKILNIKMFIDKIINNYNIKLVVIEDIQSQSNINTFKLLSWLQGVLKNYLYENGVPYLIISPATWRKELGIKGRKRDEQKISAINYVKSKYRIDVSSDVADAICIGLATIEKMKANDIKIYIEN